MRSAKCLVSEKSVPVSRKVFGGTFAFPELCLKIRRGVWGALWRAEFFKSSHR